MIPVQEATNRQLQQLHDLVPEIIPENLDVWLAWADGDQFAWGTLTLDSMISAIRTSPLSGRI